MLLSHEGAELFHYIGVLPRHVTGFTGVLGKVVEFKRSGLRIPRPRPGIQSGADGLPVSRARALLAAVAKVIGDQKDDVGLVARQSGAAQDRC